MLPVVAHVIKPHTGFWISWGFQIISSIHLCHVYGKRDDFQILLSHPHSPTSDQSSISICLSPSWHATRKNCTVNHQTISYVFDSYQTITFFFWNRLPWTNPVSLKLIFSRLCRNIAVAFYFSAFLPCMLRVVVVEALVDTHFPFKFFAVSIIIFSSFISKLYNKDLITVMFLHLFLFYGIHAFIFSYFLFLLPFSFS